MKRNVLDCHTLTLSLIIVFLLVTLGCGSKLCMIVGQVTLDGQPLENATVLFTPTEEDQGESASGFTGENGRYTIHTATGKPGHGTTKGTYIVTFKKLEAQWDGRSYHPPTWGPDGPSNERAKVMRSVETLPPLYTDRDKSPFVVTVKPKEKNVFDFKLESKPEHWKGPE